ncbi:hypothetical protein [Blastococcus sp. URHD0036]|uniref:hypothetical protein n=1 Tax=Blastococcus sp. URHD0036 TaxID=1380356 RepID=UPI00049672E8|nr:hypothetical protein [Blastococcus sp. URHD0036]
MPDDLDLRDLEEVRRRVVLPVVRSLVRPDELEEVLVELVAVPGLPAWVQEAIRSGGNSPAVGGIITEEIGPGQFPPPPSGPADHPQIRVKASGEWLEPPISWFVDLEHADPWDAEYFASEVYGLLQDELAESRLAWGELREGDHELPGPRADHSRRDLTTGFHDRFHERTDRHVDRSTWGSVGLSTCR